MIDYGFSYTGHAKNGERNGIGRINCNNGYSYFGEWKDNKRNGYGIETFPDGKRCKSLFADNKFIKSVDFN